MDKECLVEKLNIVEDALIKIGTVHEVMETARDQLTEIYEKLEMLLEHIDNGVEHFKSKLDIIKLTKREIEKEIKSLTTFNKKESLIEDKGLPLITQIRPMPIVKPPLQKGHKNG